VIAEALGSARVSRAGERVLAIANFSVTSEHLLGQYKNEVRFGGTPKPARETRALLRHDAQRKIESTG
jgi:hypothetical protein